MKVKKSSNLTVIEISSSSEVSYIKTTPSHPRDRLRQKLNKEDEKKKEKEEVIVVGDNDDEDNNVDFVRVTPSHPRDRLRRKIRNRNREVPYVKTNPAHPRYRIDCILRNQPANIMVNVDVLKDLPYFNTKIKVGEVNKIKRPEAIMDKINKQLPPNNDIYYIEYNRTTDSFKIRKDNKIKINDDSNNNIEFFKKTPSHPRDRSAHKVRKSKRLANKKVRESKTGPVIIPTGTLLAAGKIKRKYPKK